HLLVDQCAAPLGHGMRVHTEPVGNEAVVVVSQCLQARKQTSLWFIQQGVEKEDPGLHDLRVGVQQFRGSHGSSDGSLPGSELRSLQGRIDGAIQVETGYLLTSQSVLVD